MKENIRAALRPGFTLIELLVVVLIIGVLAAIALPMYQKAVEKSRAAEMIAFVGNAKRAVEAYLLQNGGQPSSPVELINGDLTGTDLRQGMNCSVVSEEDGEQCLSKHYSYRVECDNGGCFIEIRRIENQDRDQVHMVGFVEMQPGVDWYTRAAYLDKTGQVSCEELAKHFAGIGRCMGPEEAFGGGDDNGGDDNGGDDNGGDDNGGDDENEWHPGEYNANDAENALSWSDDEMIFRMRERGDWIRDAWFNSIYSQTGEYPSGFSSLTSEQLEGFANHGYFDGDTFHSYANENGSHFDYTFSCNGQSCNVQITQFSGDNVTNTGTVHIRDGGIWCNGAPSAGCSDLVSTTWGMCDSSCL